MVIRFSLGFQEVGYSTLFADGEVAGLEEVFNQIQGLGFADFMAVVCNQKADEFLLAARK